MVKKQDLQNQISQEENQYNQQDQIKKQKDYLKSKNLEKKSKKKQIQQPKIIDNLMKQQGQQQQNVSQMRQNYHKQQVETGSNNFVVVDNEQLEQQNTIKKPFQKQFYEQKYPQIQKGQQQNQNTLQHKIKPMVINNDQIEFCKFWMKGICNKFENCKKNTSSKHSYPSEKKNIDSQNEIINHKLLNENKILVTISEQQLLNMDQIMEKSKSDYEGISQTIKISYKNNKQLKKMKKDEFKNLKNEYINKNQIKEKKIQIIEKYLPLLIKDNKDENAHKVVLAKQKKLEKIKLKKMMKKDKQIIQIIKEDEEEIEESKQNTQTNSEFKPVMTNQKRHPVIFFKQQSDLISEESDAPINTSYQDFDFENNDKQNPNDAEVLTTQFNQQQIQSQTSSEYIQQTKSNTNSVQKLEQMMEGQNVILLEQHKQKFNTIKTEVFKQTGENTEEIYIVYNISLWQKIIEGYSQEDLSIQIAKLYDNEDNINSHFKKLVQNIIKYITQICKKIGEEKTKDKNYIPTRKKEQVKQTMTDAIDNIKKWIAQEHTTVNPIIYLDTKFKHVIYLIEKKCLA